MDKRTISVPRQCYMNFDEKLRLALQEQHRAIKQVNDDFDGDVSFQDIMFVEADKQRISFDKADHKQFRDKFGSIILPERKSDAYQYLGRKPYMLMPTAPMLPAHPMSALTFHMFITVRLAVTRAARMNRASFRAYTADCLNSFDGEVIHLPEIVRISDVM